VVNGNSFEADLPFLAFWMASVALFVRAVDQQSTAALMCSAIAGALAGLTAYQAVLLTPILAVYLLQRRRAWYPAWIVVLAAPLAIAAWQVWEWRHARSTSGGELLSYMRRCRNQVERVAQRRSVGRAFRLDHISAADRRRFLDQTEVAVIVDGRKRRSLPRFTM
jgi:hypothetical protein